MYVSYFLTLYNMRTEKCISQLDEFSETEHVYHQHRGHRKEYQHHPRSLIHLPFRHRSLPLIHYALNYIFLVSH